MSIFPVILCGGSGTRLWPTSRPDLPKQFIPLVGDRSSFQRTVTRVGAIRGAGQPVVIAGQRHAAVIAEELKAIGVEAVVLLEPEGRDSGPAIAAAAAWIAARDPDGIAVVVSSDHHVPDAAAFQVAADRAVIVAEQGWIVTLGVRPTEPSTAFGYIKPGPRAIADGLANAVEAFVEKPDQATAAAYITDGYLWNSGNFVARAASLLAELDQYAPAVSDAARAAVAGADVGPTGAQSLGPAFRDAPKISIDYAVMEKTTRAAVAPADFAWSDLGAWDAVKAASPVDGDRNGVTGLASLVDSTGCLVRNASAVPVGLVGVHDLAVVVEANGVLVTSLSGCQGVKRLVERIAAATAPATQGGESAPTDLGQWSARFEHWLNTNALPLWWSLGADHARGGFHESLDQTGVAVRAPRRSRVQARQVFVYASAGMAGWPGPWRGAADHGLRYLLDNYRRDDGLFDVRVGPDGETLDTPINLYDQAFALLALATMFRADPSRTDLSAVAGASLDRIRVAFAHSQGGLRESGDHPFQSNPLMHLFESALAWVEAGGGAIWEALAREMAEFAMSRLIDPDRAVIREYYAADWTPAEGEDGRAVWPGHQFEWAWLLDRWSRRTGDADARAWALRLYAAGAAGVDPARSLALDAMNESLTITDARARLWPQTERLKAALCLGEGLAEDDQATMRAHALDAAHGLWRYLETPTIGLWRDRALPAGGFADEPAPASSFYHIIGAIHALRQAAA